MSHANANAESPHFPTRTTFETISSAVVHTSDPQCSSQQCSTIASARNEVFRLGSIVGKLCSAFLAFPLNGNSETSKSYVNDEIATLLGEIFLQLFNLSRVCGTDLRSCVLKKMELNGRKYPVELCKGKSGKYTKYSKHTGITKTEGQSTVNTDVNNISFDSSISGDAEVDNGDTNETASQEKDTTTVDGVTLLLQEFASDRLWNRYHTPRNIALALMGEVGELAELFQWHGDVDSDSTVKDRVDVQSVGLLGVGWSEEEVDKVGQEIADVSIYLMRLADVCGVSLGEVSLKLID